jgi:DNA-directed RNA polymerase subunit RPC12/RpoP
MICSKCGKSFDTVSGGNFHGGVMACNDCNSSITITETTTFMSAKMKYAVYKREQGGAITHFHKIKPDQEEKAKNNLEDFNKRGNGYAQIVEADEFHEYLIGSLKETTCIDNQWIDAIEDDLSNVQDLLDEIRRKMNEKEKK